MVSASQTGRTITFTYTAPAGGINNGSVTWSSRPAGAHRPRRAQTRATRRRARAPSSVAAADDHRLLTHARGGQHGHDHLRRHRRRRPRRDSHVDHGRADLAGTGEVHLRWHPCQSRLLAEHHRLRRRRLRDADDTDHRRVGEPDRAHAHLHVHRCRRRDLERLGHARRPGRLERTLDHRGERRLHDLEPGHPHRRRADDHRGVADARRRATPSRSPTATRAAAGRARPPPRRPAHRPGRRRRSRPPPARSRTSAPRRASPSTRPTARGR